MLLGVSVLSGDSGNAGTSAQDLVQLLAGLRDVLGRLDPLSGAGLPTAAWVPQG